LNFNKPHKKTLFMKRSVVLTFPPEKSNEPITYNLIKQYDIQVNILKAKLSAGKAGTLLLQLIGKQENLDAGIEYLKLQSITCEAVDKKISLKKDQCINCGACTAVCYSGALTMNNKNWLLDFDVHKCTVCELCLKACPLLLFEINFGDDV